MDNWEMFAFDDTNVIFGDGYLDTLDSIDFGTLNDLNEVAFGINNDPNVIAVTNIWGVFSGPRRAREIVEWDMVFNEEGFDFGDANITTAPVMDFLSILTHELGHAIGMGHAPLDSVCEVETMYPTAGFDETNKRSLDVGDIAGIRALY